MSEENGLLSHAPGSEPPLRGTRSSTRNAALGPHTERGAHRGTGGPADGGAYAGRDAGRAEVTERAGVAGRGRAIRDENARDDAHADGGVLFDRAEPAEGSAPSGSAEPAEGSAQWGSAEPAEGSAQWGTTEPGEGSAQSGSAEPAEGNAQSGRTEPAEGCAQSGGTEPGDGCAQSGSAEPAEGNAAQSGRTEPGEGCARLGGAEPGDGCARSGRAEPTEGSAESGRTEPIDGSARFGSGEQVDGRARSGSAGQFDDGARSGGGEYVDGGAQVDRGANRRPGSSRGRSVGAGVRLAMRAAHDAERAATAAAATRFADHSLRAVLEVLDRRRPVEQLTGIADPLVLAAVRTLVVAGLVPDRALGSAVLARIDVRLIADGAAELCAGYDRGGRRFALAARAVRGRTGWRLTALRVR